MASRHHEDFERPIARPDISIHDLATAVRASGEPADGPVRGRLANVYGRYLLCQKTTSAERWYAVLEGVDPHPINARLIALSGDHLADRAERGIFSSTCVKFFRTRRELTRALNGD